ncbi:MAG: transposase [Candidatus Hydrogenedentes bacterium]|nr:transposase [Candidatus Hydrogenedentota bacterium]
MCLQSESVRRPPEETAATAPPRRGYVVVGAGKLRDEFLDREIFYTLKEAQVLIEQWRKLYNEIRPHSALGYKPPAPAAMLSRSEWSSLLPLTSTTPRLAVSGLT